jgi:hypothetical protein
MRRYDRMASSRRAFSYAAGQHARHELDDDARRASILLIGLFGLLLLLAIGAGLCAS